MPYKDREKQLEYMRNWYKNKHYPKGQPLKNSPIRKPSNPKPQKIGDPIDYSNEKLAVRMICQRILLKTLRGKLSVEQYLFLRENIKF